MPDFQPSSNATEIYTNHKAVLEDVALLPHNQSMYIPNHFDYDLLKDMLETINKDHKEQGLKQRFVIIRHAQFYEVTRLPDEEDTKLFYKHMSRSNNKRHLVPTGDCVMKLQELCDEYLKCGIEKYKKIDWNLTESMWENQIITGALIQRKLANISIFKHADIGGTAKVKETIERLVKNEYLVEVPKNEAEKMYGSRASMYWIKGYDNETENS